VIPESPSSRSPRYEAVAKHTEFVMGTAVTFDVIADGRESFTERATSAIDRATQWLHWVNHTFTTYDDASFVSRFSRGDVSLDECPREVAYIVEECDRYHDMTDGWFDAWAGPGGRFDPSGLVKGWATQRASEILRDAGFIRHCLNAGGDVVVRGPGPIAGTPSWGVGVAHPIVADALCAVIAVQDECVASSGIAERGLHVWRRDGTPATDLALVTVIATDLGWADAVATAALARGSGAIEWLCALEVDAYVVDVAGDEWATSGFQDRRLWPPASSGTS